MRMFSLGCALFVVLAVTATVEAGRRNCGCCYVPSCAPSGCEAPAAASPAAVAPAAAPAVAQNQSGYRSFSYQPTTAAPAPVYNYNRGPSRNYRSNQPMWMNGGNKSLGRYN